MATERDNQPYRKRQSARNRRVRRRRGKNGGIRASCDRKGWRAYAVLSFGGFLGIGDDHYPLPWHSLKYNVELGGYQTLVPVVKIKGAPKYAPSEPWDWESREPARSLDDYYGVIPA